MDNRDEESNKGVEDARLDVAVGAIALAAGFAAAPLGPGAVAVAGATAPAMKLSARLVKRARSRRKGRRAWALERAAEILDTGIDIFDERTAEDAVRLELLARVLEAAERTPLDQKVIALARVLADGFRDGGSGHEALVLAAALADLEAPHVIVLRHLAAYPLPPKELWKPEASEDPIGWEAWQLARAAPQVEDLLDGLLSVLSGHGLVRRLGDSTWAGLVAMTQYRVTPLGQRCLLLLGQEVSKPVAD
ncbi:hypothetical protein [Pseudonocardia oroxyli]|uniref:Uncharacterized protein n=1 Tax=Pseudonocardia oroxyli TaxID=366584 RepID=A0A1G7XDV2_PSEOR|nr:hypothetical protein [Pseudonocardia oroxyli]SDG82389.1 hypothetical protein SAMN05216377_115168 [Pseudonocardia oroxyli]